MNQYIISIDRGSTNVKSVVFDKQGNEILTSSYASQKPISLKSGWWEQDMNLMWDSTLKSIKGIFDRGILPEEIVGVFVSGQGNGLMPIDKYGNPARAGILSLDSRAAYIHKRWVEDGRFMKAMPVIGLPFSAGGPLPLLAWFKENEPEEFEKIDKVLFSKDWIRYKLSGVICTDQTDASGAGLMDISKNDYAWGVISDFGLGELKDKLPEIRASHEVVGTITKESAIETGLLEGTPVLCGAHDLAAYPFGVGSIDSKELVSVMGTWGFNIIPSKDLTGAPAVLYHTVPEHFLIGFGDGNSGGCLDIMLETLCGNQDYQAKYQQVSLYQYVEDMIEHTKPTGILFHPFIFGSPINNDACAGLYGVKNWHTKGDIMRSVYEGIVMGHLSGIKMLPNNDKFESMWLIGGGSKSKFIGQLFADIIGIPVKIATTNEITARGGAMNAWVGLGVYKTHSEACIPPQISIEYKPNAKMNEFYMKKYKIFSRLTEINSEIWPELNEMSL